MKDAVLAEYVRDGFVESVHRGYLLALNADGSTTLELGDSSALIFPRSCVKSIQGAAMVRAGLKLEPRLLALGCSQRGFCRAAILPLSIWLLRIWNPVGSQLNGPLPLRLLFRQPASVLNWQEPTGNSATPH